MNASLTALLDFLRGEEDSLPANVRKKVYKVVKYLAALTALVLLILPVLPGLGVNWSEAGVAATVASAVAAALGHLADPNTP
jgi:hypothetical protein